MRPQWHKNGEITQKPEVLMRFLVQITTKRPDFKIKSKKLVRLFLGDLNSN
jgi:hypothetical protein